MKNVMILRSIRYVRNKDYKDCLIGKEGNEINSSDP